MQQTFCYYIKHAQGISANVNQHSNVILGMEQAKEPMMLVSNGWSRQIVSSRHMHPKLNHGICTLPTIHFITISLIPLLTTHIYLLHNSPAKTSPISLQCCNQMWISGMTSYKQAERCWILQNACGLWFYWQIGSTGQSRILPPPATTNFALLLMGNPLFLYNYSTQWQHTNTPWHLLDNRWKLQNWT